MICELTQSIGAALVGAFCPLVPGGTSGLWVGSANCRPDQDRRNGLEQFACSGLGIVGFDLCFLGCCCLVAEQCDSSLSAVTPVLIQCRGTPAHGAIARAVDAVMCERGF